MSAVIIEFFSFVFVGSRKRSINENENNNPASHGLIPTNLSETLNINIQAPPKRQRADTPPKSQNSSEVKKRPRTAFTPEQIKRLESEFQRNKYRK